MRQDAGCENSLQISVYGNCGDFIAVCFHAVLRGFTQELRTSSSVGTDFADVVAPRGGGSGISGGDGAGPAYMFDLQSVQVLKGPQGTLFARNTTGGAVLLMPKKPTDKLEGYLEGAYGNYDMFRIQGVINVPLASWPSRRSIA